MSAVLIDSSNYVKMELGMHGRKLVSVASWEMQDCQNNIKSNYLTQNLKSILIHVQNIHPCHVFSWRFQAIFSCFSRMGWQTTCTGTRPTNGFARLPPEGFCSVCVVCSQVLRKVDEVVEGHEKKQPGLRCEDDGGVWFWSDMFFFVKLMMWWNGMRSGLWLFYLFILWTFVKVHHLSFHLCLQ